MKDLLDKSKQFMRYNEELVELAEMKKNKTNLKETKTELQR